MAKRIANSQDETVITELTVDKSEFKQKLNERIVNGEELFKRNIQTQQDLDKLKNDYSSWTDYNSELLKQSFNIPYNEYKHTYDNAGYSMFGDIGGGNYQNPVEERKYLINVKIENLKKLEAKVDLLKSSIPTHVSSFQDTKIIKSIEKNEIFIVHGHDNEAKVKAALFISRLGFKPIILHEQASSGKTIIEKIEEYTNVGFGIVLYTPCDIGGKQITSPQLKSRARQNVVFEHGYLIGKIGRNNVCALVKGDIETPNDISGVVYITMDDADAWHLKLAKELRNSGYNVDMNKIV